MTKHIAEINMVDSTPLTREQILGRNDRRIELLDIPEWDGSVYIRVVGADERDAFEMRGVDPKTGDRRRIPNFRARYAAMVVCDEDGNPLFTESDIEALGKKNAAALDRILDKGLELNRMGADAVAEAKADFDEGPSTDSGTD